MKHLSFDVWDRSVLRNLSAVYIYSFQHGTYSVAREIFLRYRDQVTELEIVFLDEDEAARDNHETSE